MVISDGSDLGFKVYSTLPGSAQQGKEEGTVRCGHKTFHVTAQRHHGLLQRHLQILLEMDYATFYVDNQWQWQSIYSQYNISSLIKAFISCLDRWTYPRSTLGWGGSHHCRWWPQDSRTSPLCSGSRRQHVLHGGLCWVSGLRSRSSWHCRKCGLFWFQLCRELDGKQGSGSRWLWDYC